MTDKLLCYVANICAKGRYESEVGLRREWRLSVLLKSEKVGKVAIVQMCTYSRNAWRTESCLASYLAACILYIIAFKAIDNCT